jgi:hypothetical protein
MATEARTGVTTRQRALAVVLLVGGAVGLAIAPAGDLGVWTLVAVSGFLAGLADIGGG